MKSQKVRAAHTAKERIEHLYALIQKEYLTHSKDAKRYAQLLKNLATKHNLRITDIKRTLCKECNTYLVAGQTATVRIHNQRRIITCTQCNTVKRLGLKTT